MNTQERLLRPAILALSLMMLGGCAAEYESGDSAMESNVARSPVALSDEDDFGGLEKAEDDSPAEASGVAQKSTQSRGRSSFGDRDLGGVAGGALQIPEDRLLEYKIQVTYRTDDYRLARQSLLEIAGKHGHLTNSYASTDPTWSMNTSMRIRVAEMYGVLKELDRLGELESEQIQSTDHTENMVLAERQYRRERLRLVRRSAAARQTPAANKTWAQREQLIEQSEDRQDQAEHEQWKINDRVNFAQIDVHLLGPELPVQVEVPPYQNAFLILVNWFLELLYAMILAAPLWLLLLLVWIKRGAIKALLGIKPKAE